MFIIRRMSQRYSVIQDRVHINIANPEDRIVSLWLTFRVANELVGLLSPKIDEIQEKLKSNEGRPFKEVKRAVDPDPPSPLSAFGAIDEGVIRSIEFFSNEKGYFLTFHWGAMGLARIGMQANELNKFMKGMHKLFDMANWPKLSWPKAFQLLKAEKSDHPTIDQEVSKFLH